jgi:Domain of unknown function (DUF222)
MVSAGEATRVPQLGQRCLTGEVDMRVIAAIDLRTALVSDVDILAVLDRRPAAAAAEWNGLSRRKLDEVIDRLIVILDPEARRVARPRRRPPRRDHPGQRGMADLWIQLPAVAAPR